MHSGVVQYVTHGSVCDVNVYIWWVAKWSLQLGILPIIVCVSDCSNIGRERGGGGGMRVRGNGDTGESI